MVQWVSYTYFCEVHLYAQFGPSWQEGHLTLHQETSDSVDMWDLNINIITQ